MRLFNLGYSVCQTIETTEFSVTQAFPPPITYVTNPCHHIHAVIVVLAVYELDEWVREVNIVKML